MSPIRRPFHPLWVQLCGCLLPTPAPPSPPTPPFLEPSQTPPPLCPDQEHLRRYSQRCRPRREEEKKKKVHAGKLQTSQDVNHTIGQGCSSRGQSHWRTPCASPPPQLVRFSPAETRGPASSSRWWSRLGPTGQRPPGPGQEPGPPLCHDSCATLKNANKLDLTPSKSNKDMWNVALNNKTISLRHEETC